MINKRPRSDQGKRRKIKVSPEYWAYLSRHNKAKGRLMGELELMELLALGCSLCGEPATHVRGRIGYCPLCDRHMGLGAEAEVLAWVRKVYAYRLS